MSGLDKQRRSGPGRIEAAPKVEIGAANAMLQAMKLTAQTSELVAVACAVQGR